MLAAVVVILLGAPGAGKGTQALRLADHVGLPHVSTGDLFREHRSQGTDLGREAQTFMDKGELVPDSLVLDMLFDRVGRPDCERGYLLDGFPRTVPQAEALEERLGDGARPCVLRLVVSDETILERAAGRLLCRGCSHIHHRTFSPPAAPGVCDSCGGELYQRADDAVDVVRERLRVYHEQTAPLARWYEARGLLENVDGERTPDEVFADLAARTRLEEEA